MSREIHVRFWEGVGVRFPHATRLRYFTRNSIEGHRRLTHDFSSFILACKIGGEDSISHKPHYFWQPFNKRFRGFEQPLREYRTQPLSDYCFRL